VVGGRVPKIDEDTIRILSEEAIIVYLNYLDQLKGLYTQFIHQNFNAGKKVMSWKDTSDKNLPMITRCFVKMARVKELIPHMFNIEDMQSYLKATIPPITGEEYQFFENNEVIRFYEQDMVAPVVVCDPRVGEPGLLFHEFIFLLSRIALANVNTSGNVSGKLNDFFSEKLGFQRVIDVLRARVTFEDIARRVN